MKKKVQYEKSENPPIDIPVGSILGGSSVLLPNQMKVPRINLIQVSTPIGNLPATQVQYPLVSMKAAKKYIPVIGNIYDAIKNNEQGDRLGVATSIAGLIPNPYIKALSVADDVWQLVAPKSREEFKKGNWLPSSGGLYKSAYEEFKNVPRDGVIGPPTERQKAIRQFQQVNPFIPKKKVQYRKGGGSDEFNEKLDNAPVSKDYDLKQIKDWDSNLYQNDRNANIINDLQRHDPSFNYYQAWKDSGEPSLNRFNTDRSHYNSPTNSINMSIDSPHMFQEEIGHALQNKQYQNGDLYRQSISNVIYRKPETTHDRGEFQDYNEDGLHPYILTDNILATDYNTSLKYPQSYLNRGNYQASYPDDYFKSATTDSIDKKHEYYNDLFTEHMVNEQGKLRSVNKYAADGFLPDDYAISKIYDITQPMSYYTHGNVENENHNYIQPNIIEPRYDVDLQKGNEYYSSIRKIFNLMKR